MMAANDDFIMASKNAMIGESTFSVKKRIVLHLGEFSSTQMDFYRMPYALTQDGIAIAAQISRAHTSIELKKLKEKGFVKEAQAHVTKGTAIRKIYVLTEEGMRFHRDLETELKKQNLDKGQILASLNENGCEKRDPYLEAALQKTMKAAQDMMSLRSTGHKDYRPVISELLSAASTLVGKP